MSPSAEDKQVEGEAAYQLGVTYQRAGDTDTAKQVPECVCVAFALNSNVFLFANVTCLSHCVCPVLQHLHADLHVTAGRRWTGEVLLCHDQVFREVHTHT